MNRHLPQGLRPVQLVLVLLFGLRAGLAGSTVAADQALQQGRIDDSISLLRSTIASNPDDALSHNLLCRAYYAEQHPEAAIPECEAAVAHDSSNSDFALWLGRAYGQKAELSGPINSIAMAKRAHAMFERAVQLDGRNVHAASDLGEYYVDAPSFLGGGADQAEKLAVQMQAVSPARSHRLLGLAAEKRDDYATAEKEFQAEVSSSRSPETLIDLALFYRRRNRFDQAVAVIESAVEIDRNEDFSIVDAASILNEMKRDPQLAVQLYRRYLASAARTEAAPAPRVHVLLGRTLVALGDKDAARREFQAALALASAYDPARSELKKLPTS